MKYALFAYGGDGILSVGEGLGGVQASEVFEYDIDTGSKGNTSQIDVLSFVRDAISKGHTHVGFALRDLNTEASFLSDQQYLSTSNTNSYSRPPLLIVHAADSAPHAAAAAPSATAFESAAPALAASQAEADGSPVMAELETFYHWTFDTDVRTSGDNSFDGYLWGQAKVAQGGSILGTGCYLGNGNGNLDADPDGISGSLPRSISLWFRTNGGTGTYDTLVGWGLDFPGRSYDLQMAGSNLRLNVTGTNLLFRLSKGVKDGQWHHALLTYTGGPLSNHRLYVDGRFASQVNSSLVPDTYEYRSIQIGADSVRTSPSSFSGRIDDLGVFPQALDESHAALINGLARISGLDLSYLPAALQLWSVNWGGAARLGAADWIKTEGLTGTPGTFGGSASAYSAFIVVDDNGGGIQMLRPAAADQFQTPDGDLDLALGFGKSGSLTPSLSNNGDRATWHLLWEDEESNALLETAATNLGRLSSSVLAPIPDRHRFSGGETGNFIDSTSGIYSSGGNRIYINNTQINYTGGDIVQSSLNGKTARYYTKNLGGLFACIADLEGGADFRVSDSYIPYNRELSSSFTFQGPDGATYRAFTRTLVTETLDRPSLHQLLFVKDAPGITKSTDPLRLSNLPDSCRVHYLMFARPDGSPYSPSTLLQLASQFLAASRNGVGWAWAEPSNGVANAFGETPVTLQVDAAGLSPGLHHTRYSIVPGDTQISEVPEDAWQSLSLTVGEPDFELPEPMFSYTSLGGGVPQSAFLELPTADPSSFEITTLTSGASWLTPTISEGQANLIKLVFDSTGLEVGSYSTTLTIETASTRRILDVSFTVQAQQIISMRTDYQRNRIYALNRTTSDESRLLVYDAQDTRWVGSVELGDNAADFSIHPDGHELYVIHNGGQLWRVDLEQLAVVGKRNVAPLTSSWDVRYESSKIAAGHGSVAYVAPSAYLWAPVLMVDVETGQLLGTVDGDGVEDDGRAERVASLVYNPLSSELFTWTGSSNNTSADSIGHFRADADGLLEIVDSIEVDVGENNATIAVSRDGSKLFIGDRQIDPDNISRLPAKYLATMRAITPNGEVVVTRSQLIDSASAEVLAEIPNINSYKVVSADYSRLFYFDVAAGLIKSINLFDLVGEEALGLRLEPADSANVLPPEFLRWKPVAGAIGYRVYLAETRQALEVAVPDPSLLFAPVANHWAATGDIWQAGATYFWRVDPVMADATSIAGQVLSFKISNLSIDRRDLLVATVAGVDGRKEIIQVTSANQATPLAATSEQDWLIVTPASAIAPGTFEIQIDAGTLSKGEYRGQVTIRQGDDSITIDVTAQVNGLYLRRVHGDAETSFVYLFSREEYGDKSEFLLRFNTDLETFDGVLEVPFGSVSSEVHPGDRRLYIAYGGYGRTGQLQGIDLDTFQPDGQLLELPEALGTAGWSSATPLVAGPPGVLILGRSAFHMFDTRSMSVVGAPLGSGVYLQPRACAVDRTNGSIFISGDKTDGKFWVSRYDVIDGNPTEVVTRRADFYSYDSRNSMHLSDDGRRLWRGRGIFDADLNFLALADAYQNDYGPFILDSTAKGEFGASNSVLFNGTNGLPVGKLADSSPYLAIASDDRRIFQFGSRQATWVVTDLEELASVDDGDITPDIADGAIRFHTSLPLSWQADSKAIRYRVYLGTDAAAVAAAGPDSPLRLGEPESSSLELTTPLNFDQQYFWRVDVVGLTSTRTGGVHSFRTASFNTTPLLFQAKGVAGVPLEEQSISLESPEPTSWTASSETPWIELIDTAGETPASLRFKIDTSSLSSGLHEGSITLSSGSGTWTYPVSVELDAVSISIARIDPESDLMYAISQVGLDRNGDDPIPANLIVYDASSGLPLRSVPVGTSVRDLQIDPQGNRLYLTNWKSGILRVLDLETLETLHTYSFAPYSSSLKGVGDAFSLAIGNDGRIVMGEAYTPTQLRLVDGETGNILDTWSPVPLALGAGSHAFLPGGRFLIHYSPSNGSLMKLDTLGDRFVQVAEIFLTSGGGLPVIISADGNRIYAGQGVFDTDLNLVETKGTSFVQLTSDEAIGFNQASVWNTGSDRLIRSNPSNTTAVVLAEKHGKVFFFTGPAQPQAFDLEEILSLKPEGTLVPGIADASTVIGADPDLSWGLDPAAYSYAIYLGTSETAVASAGPDSPEFLGVTSAGSFSLPSELTLGSSYFWRIDTSGYGGVSRKGTVWSFKVAQLDFEPRSLQLANPDGVPYPEQSLVIQSDAPTLWSATSNVAWLTLVNGSGTAPDTLRFNVDQTSLTSGAHHEAVITVTTGGESLEIPVSFYKGYIQALDLVADRERPLLYVGSGSTHGAQRDRPAFFIVIDAETEAPIRAIPMGTGGNTTVTVHYPDNRIYVGNFVSGKTSILDRDSFEQVGELPFLSGATAPGSEGRAAIVSSGLNKIHLIDSFTGDDVAVSDFDGRPLYWDLQSGYGSFDPGGESYYFGEASSGDFFKFDTSGDQMTAVSVARGTDDSSSGTSVVRDLDGSHYYWGGRVFDADLNPIWNFGSLVQSTWGISAKDLDEYGSRIFTQDGLGVIRVFDFEKRKFLFQLQQARNYDIAYSIPTGKLFDTQTLSGVVFQSVVEPLIAPPGIVWASGGSAPWVPAPEEGPGVMVSSPTEVYNLGSRCTAHIPSAATLRFQWKTETPTGTSGTLRLMLDGQAVEYTGGTSDWKDVSIEVPAGGHYVTWFCDTQPNTSGQAMRGFVRDIAVLRSGPVRPRFTTTATPPADNVDSDGDGSSDLLEWAAGSAFGNPAQMPKIRHFVSGGNMVFQFDRRLGMQGATLHAEVSENLDQWRELIFPELRQVDVRGEFETLEVRLPFGGVERFIRLHAKLTP